MARARRWAAWGAVAVAAAGIAGGVRLSRHAEAPRASSAPPAVASEAPLHLAWARGARYVYDVRWSAESRAALGGDGAQTVDGSARLEGELALSALGEAEGRTVLAARFTRLDAHALRVMGGEIAASDEEARATFVGRDAFVTVARDGTFDAVYFAKGSPAAFEHVMTALLAETELVIPGDGRAEWTAREKDATGTAVVRYAMASDDARAVTRARVHYDALVAAPGGGDGCGQALDDRGRAEIDRDGFVRAIDDDARLAVTRDGKPVLASSSALHLRWRRTEAFDPPTQVAIDRASLDERRPGEAVASRDPAERLLERRAAGLDRDGLLGGLRAYDAMNGVDRSFVARASALIALHPELCDEIAAIVADDATRTKGRALSLDVLASADTDASQAAMRRALASTAARRDPAYPVLLQRFTALGRPTPESARFVADAWSLAASRGERDTRDAAAYALGAMTKALARGDDRSAARAYDARLRRALDDAKTPRDRVTYLTALGNAGDPSDAPAIAAYAQADDPSVRAAAANALRNATTDDARAALLGLVGDDDAGVQALALGALDARGVDARDVTAVASKVEAGGVAPSNEGALVTFLAKHQAESPSDAHAAMVAILAGAQMRGDRQLAARIKTLLGGGA